MDKHPYNDDILTAVLRDYFLEKKHPVHFPDLLLIQNIKNSTQWSVLKKYLQDKKEDVTSDVKWDSKGNHPFFSSIQSKKQFHCYALALCSEAALDDLCKAPYQFSNYKIFFKRTGVFCKWDEMFVNSALHNYPMIPPFFIETRKMIRIECVREDTNANKIAINKRALTANNIEEKIVCFALTAKNIKEKIVCLPGYIMPDIEIESIKCRESEFLDRPEGRYRTIFRGLNKINEDSVIGIDIFYENKKEKININDPRLIHEDRYKAFFSNTKVKRYEIFSCKQNEKFNNFLLSASKQLNPGEREALRKIASLRSECLPVASFSDFFISNIPSFGDIAHLLQSMPLTKKLNITVSNIISVNKDLIIDFLSENCGIREIYDYSWSVNNNPAIPAPCCILIEFDMQNKQLYAFAENIYDYLCSYLSQFFKGPYEVLSMNRLKRYGFKADENA